MSGLSFGEILPLTRGRIGISDGPCPVCSDVHNPRRRVFRVWVSEASFATYHCVRCGTSGWVRDGKSSGRPSPEHLERLRRDAAARDSAQDKAQLTKARWLWRSSGPPSDTVVETYLRARGYGGPIPATVRYLPARGHYQPAMIAAFGMCEELEPGVLAIRDDAVRGVHLTRLRADGSWKAGTDKDKIMVGRSTGWPIVLVPPNDLLGLAISEGIENGLSAHEATGLGVWAAGCADRMPLLADKVPRYIDCVTVFADPEEMGRKKAQKLVAALRDAHLCADLFVPPAAGTVA